MSTAITITLLGCALVLVATIAYATGYGAGTRWQHEHARRQLHPAIRYGLQRNPEPTPDETPGTWAAEMERSAGRARGALRTIAEEFRLPYDA